VGIIKDGKYIPDEGKADTESLIEIKLAVALINFTKGTIKCSKT